MKRYTILFALIAVFPLLFSCQSPEIEPQEVNEEGIPVTVELPFYVNSGSAVKVGTKMTLGDQFEGNLYNIYVAIYNSDGGLMYSEYFDTDSDGWTYSQTGSEGQGTVSLNTYTSNNCAIYAVGNIDPEMTNLNSAKLMSVGQSEAGLQAMIVKLSQDIPSRDGFFLMTGWMHDVDIVSSGAIRIKTNAATTTSYGGNTGTESKLKISRIDSKVQFNITCAPPDDPLTKPTIKSFNPQKWQVINLPRRAYVIGGIDGNDYTQFAGDPDNYFNTPKYGSFHTTAHSPYDTVYFSFYVIENQVTAKHSVSNFVERERQVKDANGMNGAWLNAPDYGTYVIITGEVTMDDVDYDETDGGLIPDAAGKTLASQVQYIVHLGDISSGLNNYSIERNFNYTYNITIKGVDDITVEVITSDNSVRGGGSPSDAVENTPGATGDVTIATEAYVLLDAHYHAFVHRFKEIHINEDMTWYVKTPFAVGEAASNPCDYKWVKFRINERAAGEYKSNRRPFKPYDFANGITTIPEANINYNADYGGAKGSATESPLMDITQLVNYLKQQWRNYEAGETNYFDDNKEIAVTVYVDENYYEENPIDGSKSQTLWKQFVGLRVEPRILHILSRTMNSYDEESFVTASAITIKQKVIQTVYNTTEDTDIVRAWGFEALDEDLLVKDANGYIWQKEGNTGGANNDWINGRANTATLWGVWTSGDNWTALDWSTFVDMESPDEENVTEDDMIGMQPNYDYARYRCMKRNRDNNGNGKIDPDEVRWYLASQNQIGGIWIGNYTLENSARYYIPSASQWAVHYVTSTISNNTPIIVWAEEYGSTSNISSSVNETYVSPKGSTMHLIRCARNLGTSNNGNPTADSAHFQQYAQVSGNNTTGFTFDMSRLAEDNFREFRSQELVYGDESSIINNRVCRKFMTAPREANITFASTSFDNINAAIGVGLENPYCPEGYRLPNNRELILMYNYISDKTFWTGNPHTNGYISRSWWSLGIHGSGVGTQGAQKRSICVQGDGNLTSTGDNGVNSYVLNETTARCVKDVYTIDLAD